MTKAKRPATHEHLPAKIPVGISACLLGQNVRYDGGHKLDRFIQDTLGVYLRFIPVCPEVDIGLGVPRETLRLVRDDARANNPIRLVASKSGADHTRRMNAYSRAKLCDLRTEGLCGHIAKQGSPSCGAGRVRIHRSAGSARAETGPGLFTGMLIEHFPNLPLAQEDRLNDLRLRENFIVRIFAYRRVRMLFGSQWTIDDLAAFHERERLLLLSHDRKTYQQLSRLVARANRQPRALLAGTYERLFMAALEKLATRAKQTSVLQHVARHVDAHLDAAERRELRDMIQAYRSGCVPWVVPVTLLRHHARSHELTAIAEQSYLNLHPSELMLRNHV